MNVEALKAELEALDPQKQPTAASIPASAPIGDHADRENYRRYVVYEESMRGIPATFEEWQRNRKLIEKVLGEFRLLKRCGASIEALIHE